MIAQRAAVRLSRLGPRYDKETLQSAYRRLERFSPSQGWVTFGLLLLMLMIVGDSLLKARWVETPGLTLVLALGALTGLVLGKTKAHWALLHIGGLALGAVVVVWQVSSLVEGPSRVDRTRALWDRVTTWYDAVVSGGISTDLLPFSIAILTLGWILGYLGAWFIFRRNNVWVSVVLGGVAILTNLSFLPSSYAIRFFAFTFVAMLLVARMSTLQTHDVWRRLRIGFSPLTSWLTLHSTAWFSLLVVILAAVLPLKTATPGPAVDTWNFGRAPIEYLEDEFARLFAGIPSRKNLPGRFFGTTLPFLGRISFDGETVLQASTEYPSYWLSQTYSEYTKKGWISGETRSLQVGPDTLQPPRGDSLRRESTEQTVSLNFGTSDLLVGGSLDWISEEAVVEVLKPKEFEIDLLDPARDVLLPGDVGQLADLLRESLSPPPDRFIESYVSRILPDDLVLISVTPDERADDRSTVETVTLARKEAITPEVISWRFADSQPAGGSYSMVSFVSSVTDGELRRASTEYNRFITDHYLQLSFGLPQRVRDLAEELTKDAPTPVDKALAIRSYLRGPEFIYSEEIEVPPAEADGVDHFLFETKKGYSDYFASAMAVMLRTVGVPARIAAGYGPGDLSESGLRQVHDFDSHTWTQVYFPNYGWIDFEPTKRWAVHARQALAEPGSVVGAGGVQTENLLLGEDLANITDPFAEDFDVGEGSGRTRGGSGTDPTAFIFPAAIAVALAASLLLLVQLAWTLSLSRGSDEEKAYTKMSRFGLLAGIGRRTHQTPREYATAIGRAVPAAGPGALIIADTFSATRYGQGEADEQVAERLGEAWKSIRGGLLARALGRLSPTAWGRG